jgi:hypothetical protein
LNRPGGDVALKPGRYLAEHRSTIRLSVEPYYRQEHRLLERAKDVRHCNYIVAIRSSQSSSLGPEPSPRNPVCRRAGRGGPSWMSGFERCLSRGFLDWLTKGRERQRRF